MSMSMNKWMALVLPLAAALSACDATQTCSKSTDCPGGTCAPSTRSSSQFCLSLDSSCTSGLRWSRSAGDGLANMCAGSDSERDMKSSRLDSSTLNDSSTINDSSTFTPNDLAAPYDLTFSVRNGVDYLFPLASSSVPQLTSSGYTFAARFLSGSSPLTSSEASSLESAGLNVVSISEVQAQGALNGSSQGASDAMLALTQAAAAGEPADRPIYFAVDFMATSTQQANINSYFDGVASVISLNRIGAYGGYDVIKALFDSGKITWGWQASLYSPTGQWDARAQLRQMSPGGVTVGGNVFTLDQSAAADFGQW
jgi:hypothetical protein